MYSASQGEHSGRKREQDKEREMREYTNFNIH